MKLDFIALDKLSISPANMRTGKKPPDIANILPSVRALGILQTLLVRPNCAEGCFEIVAGKRRYYAAKAVAEETGTAEPLPCAIIEAGDDAAALEASLIENIARLDADEVTRWEQFTPDNRHYFPNRQKAATLRPQTNSRPLLKIRNLENLDIFLWI
jgi:ParB family transcriptional regulator, chromosome partitioning protein